MLQPTRQAMRLTYYLKNRPQQPKVILQAMGSATETG
jgi:hypothetical protein